MFPKNTKLDKLISGLQYSEDQIWVITEYIKEIFDNN